MRLATFRNDHGEARLGAVLNDSIVDLNAAYRAMLEHRGEPRAAELAHALVPADMIGFLDGGDRAIGAAREVLDQVSSMGPAGARERHLAYPAASVKLLAPVPSPRKLILVGLNYRDHAEETGNKIPEVPTLFSKYPNTVIAPGDPIKIPRVSSKIDYEGEYAFVIGKGGRDIPKNKALDHVVGYTVVNDVSCRDYQMRTGQWMIGKTFDTFCPMGPYLVLKDEVPDPHNLELSTYLNGERVQHSNTKNLIFNTNDLIAYISECFTLEPGDVVSTGTPGGVGAARKPQLWMKAGDVVRVEISGLGVLENPLENL
jgi:acylpyruvate hydrolase